MSQLGCTHNHSTKTVLIKVTNNLLIASDNSLICVLVILDLRAAFNAIDHNILLKRLKHFIRIKGTALDWFKSYSSDRFYFLHINDVSSTHARGISSVPQGSGLGPILFTLYMLPLGIVIRKMTYISIVMPMIQSSILSIKPEKTNQLQSLQVCLEDRGLHNLLFFSF